ncbi:MAG: DUF2752 domain-containing protein [Myxococcota bacterium]|nr:DUF2752 domain-containing protein [Myxococcota bacterium]MEC9388720.1 DUF2752 domain-containing protein [Myxococcota bacterium]
MKQPPHASGERFIWIALVGIWGASFVYTNTPLNDEVWCVWRRFVSLECFGCGLTRSFIAASAGDLSLSMRSHPAGPFLYAAMVWNILAMTARQITARPALGRLPHRAVVVFWCVTGLVFCSHAARVVGGWFDA